MNIANDDKRGTGGSRECRRCQFRSLHIVHGDVCLHRDGKNPNSGDPMNVILVRAPVGFCGPQARLHRPANDDARRL